MPFDLDERIQSLSRGTVAASSAVLAVLPLFGLPAAPLLGDVLLAGLSVLALAAGFGVDRHRTKLLALPLVIADNAARHPGDGRLRIQLWLGRGRPMRDVKLVAHSNGQQARAGAAGPVVGPWTAVLDLPAGPIRVEASCRSAGREWSANAEIQELKGRFAPPVTGSAGSLSWNRSAWGAVRDEEPTEDVQDR